MGKKFFGKGETYMNKYVSPEIEVTLLLTEDILTGSDVLIDGGDLWEE